MTETENMKLEDLAKLYEQKKDELGRLANELDALETQYDTVREYDTANVWCYRCDKTHRINTDVAREHEAAKIPKQCFTKYDHVNRYIGKREEPDVKRFSTREEYPMIKTIGMYECIVCGHKSERLAFWHGSP